MDADVQRPLLPLQEELEPETPQEKESDKGDKQLWEIAIDYRRVD